jgi:succinate dehydrogenase/fumarate reductase flavoprotein subunit
MSNARRESDPAATPGEPSGDGDAEKLRSAIQRTMSSDCGVVRDAAGLAVASLTLTELGGLAGDLPPDVVAGCEVRNLVRTSRAIVLAAATREESRGAHTRADFPETSDASGADRVAAIATRRSCRCCPSFRRVAARLGSSAPYLRSLVAGVG